MMLKIAIVTNELAPYRTPVFSKIAEMPGVELHVFACIEREPNRQWTYPPMACGITILRTRFITMGQRYIHNNIDVITALRRFSPDVVVTDGFNPTHLYAFFFALLSGRPHVSMTDGTQTSEQTLTLLHRAVRRFVFSNSKAFVSASRGGQRLHESYGVPRELCFNSSLCVDNATFRVESGGQEKKFDFIYCGRIEEIKNPLFALDVAVQVAKRLRRKVKMLFVGSGSQQEDVKKEVLLFPGLVEVEFFGHAAQHQLPQLYGSARLLLFPAVRDRWGVVVNEACAAGLPVIASSDAGVAGELVHEGENGFVCRLDVDVWADKAEYLLTQPAVYQRFSEKSIAMVRSYTFDNAAIGLVAACRIAASSISELRKSRQIAKSRPRVLIVERQLLNYRVAFYNRLRALLEREGIELQLLIGDGTPAEKKKKNEVSLEWASRIPTHYILGTNLCWQPFGAYAKEADLVIVMHENKIIYNLWLMLFARPKRLAFWGHGANMQSDRPDGFKERFKRWTIKKVDWWFAYTETSAALVAGAGFPSERTTVVQNAIDTEEMTALCRQIGAADCCRKREELKLGDGPVGLYLGSLYKEKRLDFLIDAAQRIRQRIPGFQLLIVGAGPEQEQIEAAAKRLSWIRYLGPLQDKMKAEVLVLADVMLNPGLVGLGILDSFTSGTPMFTTDCGLHSPEISYLSSGNNGVMTRNDVNAYANAVVDALLEPEAIARLSKGALSSAPRYTVENMADRIRRGICACLAS